jgi:O-antigen ligase
VGALRRLPLEGAIRVAIPSTIVAVALGSNWSPSVRHVAAPLWRLSLVTLCLLALVWAVRQAGWRGLRDGVRTPAHAAAAAFAAVAAASTLWSTDPRLTLERTFSIGLALLAAAALGLGSSRRPGAVERLLVSVLAGALAVAVAGLAVLVVAPGDALQSATATIPGRYRGIGQNPNTVPLLLALAVPLALWLWTSRKALAAGALLLFDGSIVASGSRGALIAALAGAVVWVATLRRPWRLRLALLAAAAAVFAADVAIMQVPKPLPAAGHPATRPERALTNAQFVVPLEDELGRPGKGAPPIRRTLFGTSGRARAWDGALHQIARRPVAGYGFGTEQFAFVDRYYGFDSSVPESSYIGAALQLGVVGLAALLALLGAIGMVAVRAVRTLTGQALAEARACASVVVAGVVLGVTQSYLTSPGNLASSTFWIAALCLPGLAAKRA